MILGVDKTFYVLVISRFVNGFVALGLTLSKPHNCALVGRPLKIYHVMNIE